MFFLASLVLTTVTLNIFATPPKLFKLTRTSNVGYPQSALPVKITHCLDREAVAGTDTLLYHGATVEPSLAVNPHNQCNIVAAWQQDRFNNGGCLDIGIGYTFDGGRTWQRTELPLQYCNGSIALRASDPWVSFAPDGKRIYLTALFVNVNSLPNTLNQSGIIASTSTDGGKTWSCPAYLATNTNQALAPFDDKNTLTADPNRKLNAYAVWDRFPQAISFHSDTYLSKTTDGGIVWSDLQLIYNPFPDLCNTGMSNCIENDNQTIGNVIVVLPKVKKHCSKWNSDHWGKDSNKRNRLSGDLLNFMARIYATPNATDEEYINDTWPFKFTLIDIAHVRSKDKGDTWNTDATLVVPSPPPGLCYPIVFTGGYSYNPDDSIAGGKGSLMRDGAVIPSYNVNPENGFLYVVFQTSTLRSDFLPQIGIVTSRDGGNIWSKTAQANRTPSNAANPQAFTPFVAVTKNGYVGVLYNDFRNDDMSNPERTNTDAWLAIYKEMDDAQGGSTGIGLDFVQEIRLSKQSYIAQFGPLTSGGLMTNGDYSSLQTFNDNFYALYTKTHDGPFAPPFLFFEDPETNARLFVDDNYRQSPFVSIIKPECRCHKK